MLLKLLRSFLKRENGNVAMIIAIAMIPMTITAGVAIDFVRAHLAKTSLQQAIDAAGLASGSDASTTDDQVRSMAQAFLAANATGLNLKSTNVTTQEVGGIEYVSIMATAAMDTTFMRLANINTLDVTINSVVQRKESGRLHVALVLDTTASMMAVPRSGGVELKMTALQDAATSLAEDILSPDAPNTKVAVVPYAGYVRLYNPPEARSLQDKGMLPSWIEGLYTDHCSQSYLSCPAIIPPNTVPTCIGDGGFLVKGNACCTRPCVPGTPIIRWGFLGCMGTRASEDDLTLDRRISNPSAPPFPGMSLVGHCVNSKALALTANETAVTNRTRSLEGGGETYIPSGLTWGWAMLASEQMFGVEPMPSFGAKGGRKALVLMTDGTNTLRRQSPTSPLMVSSNRSVGDSITADLCTNIKNDGIEIFTVAFDVDDVATEQLLRTCASDAVNNFFPASNNAGLRKAFRDISNKLRSVKLTQ